MWAHDSSKHLRNLYRNISCESVSSVPNTQSSYIKIKGHSTFDVQEKIFDATDQNVRLKVITSNLMTLGRQLSFYEDGTRDKGFGDKILYGSTNNRSFILGILNFFQAAVFRFVNNVYNSIENYPESVKNKFLELKVSVPDPKTFKSAFLKVNF